MGCIGNTAQSGGTSNPVVTNTLFIENRNIGGEGIITSKESGGTCHPVLTNCAFQSNSTASFGGIVTSQNGSIIDLINCSFQGNRGSLDISVVRTQAAITLVNCIFWDNGPFTAAFIGPISAEYSLFPTSTTGITGSTNLTVTVSPFASTTSTELRDCSPAINAGNPATTSATVGTTDLAGNSRFYNGGRVDMGAYEFAGDGQPLSFSVLGSGTATCASSPTISLSGSETGVAYQLQRDGANMGSTVTGTGSALSFGPQSLSGTYTVLATRSGSSCTLVMARSATVSSNTAAPTALLTASPSATLTCAAPSVTLTGGGGSSYVFSGPSGFVGGSGTTRVVSTSGVYSLTAIASNGCFGTTTLAISSNSSGPSVGVSLLASTSAVCAGGNVSVAAGITGSASGYQWYKDGQSLGSGQQSATLGLGGVQAAQAGSYGLFVTGGCGSAMSTAFSLTVNALPVVTLSLLNNGAVLQATGGVLYERLIVVDRIGSYEIRQTDSSSHGFFNITRSGPFRLTVTGANGCRALVDSNTADLPR